MAGPHDKKDGIFTWVFIGVCCAGAIGCLLWLVASHKIVYYSAPVLDVLGSPWKLVPGTWGKQTVNDLSARYFVSRQYARHMAFLDWLTYVNLALRPWTIAFIAIVVWVYKRQSKKIVSQRLNKRLSPNQLATHMMKVFSDIAPVVAIQDKLVGNKLKKWARQVFPEELVRRAKFQGKSILVPDAEGDQLVIDHERLTGYLKITKPWKYKNVQLLRSPHLGRQIVDLIKDAGNKDLEITDRLSDPGKAIFAILAPFAFGAGKGKVQSKVVSDALNHSAYGSTEGMANLSIEPVARSYAQWCAHPLVKKMAKIHNWEYTFLFALLEYARKSGKIGTWSFIWLKPMERTMFYVLNTSGRKTPHAEAGLAFSQYQYEERVARAGRLPLTHDNEPFIFTTQVVRALEEEWEFWKNGDEDTEDWWKATGEEDSNEAYLSELRNSMTMPTNLPQQQ